MGQSERERWIRAPIAGSLVALGLGGLLAAFGLGWGWTPVERAVAIAAVSGGVGALAAGLALVLHRLGPPVVAFACIVLVAVVTGPGLGASSEGDGKGRTVVLITIDTLRRDHVGAYPDAAVQS